MTPFIVQQFAVGANHASTTRPFWMLNPPLFADYAREIKQQWRGYQGVQLSGLHTDKTWGKPTVTLTFGKLSRSEFAYLLGLKGACTLRCRNEDTNTFGNYNAVLRQVTAGSFTKSGDMYEAVIATFIDLTAI